MQEFRWPIIITTAVLALALFFGVNYYRQRYMIEEPLLELLQRKETIEEARLVKENDVEYLEITPSRSYRGPLQDLVVEVQDLAAELYRRPLEITVRDRRNERLEDYARTIAPDLYEGARLANYRSVAESVTAAAADYNLEEVLFSVDYERLYLQARDGEHTLYLIIPLNRAEGGVS
ncbi:MAG TPA: hypothetical protein PLY40_09855 [Bacillota bacterium]|nr:hypothetical protein [Bacillota bacterium]